MQQRVKVCRCREDGTADVVHVRQSACSGDCHKCSGCGAAKETIVLTVKNPIGAKVGDIVYIHSESGPVLAGAAVLYMLPLVLFFLGFFLGASWDMGALSGGIGFVLGIALAALYDRVIARKKKTVYTITGWAQDL